MVPYVLLQAIPSAHISWKYKDTFINNGSTLLSDIDMRHYYHVETPLDKVPGEDSGVDPDRVMSVTRSELFLSAGATVDDNGTFSCMAENQAGRAEAKFTLHVVVPMPPKPPQVS